MEQPIGLCSVCGGVVVKDMSPWGGTHSPVAHCRACGAVEATSLPVIQMQPRKMETFSMMERLAK